MSNIVVYISCASILATSIMYIIAGARLLKSVKPGKRLFSVPSFGIGVCSFVIIVAIKKLLS